MTLREAIRALLTDADRRTAFRDDPEGFLADHDLAGLGPEELGSALAHYADLAPLPQADLLAPLLQPDAHVGGFDGAGPGTAVGVLAGVVGRAEDATPLEDPAPLEEDPGELDELDGLAAPRDDVPPGVVAGDADADEVPDFGRGADPAAPEHGAGSGAGDGDRDVGEEPPTWAADLIPADAVPDPLLADDGAAPGDTADGAGPADPWAALDEPPPDPVDDGPLET